MASTVVAGIAARAAKSPGLSQPAADAVSEERWPSNALATAAADTCQTKGIEISQTSTILRVAPLTEAATFSRHSPTHATSGRTASGVENVEPRTCQRLTAKAAARNAAI